MTDTDYPWEGTGWDGDNEWEFTSAADDTPEQLYNLWDGAVERSRARLNAALANGGLDQSVNLTSTDGRHASLRRLVCNLIEEYGRHTGHADLIREAVDGRVGEDPSPGWHLTRRPAAILRGIAGLRSSFGLVRSGRALAMRGDRGPLAGRGIRAVVLPECIGGTLGSWRPFSARVHRVEFSGPVEFSG